MATSTLPRQPTLPPQLKTAARGGKLIIFVGAGVSKLLGYPSWREFADKSLSYLISKKVINHARKSLLSTLDPRTILSITQRLLAKNDKEFPYKSFFTDRPDRKISDIYTRLYSIGSVFITTNYDTKLDEQATLGVEAWTGTLSATANNQEPSDAPTTKISKGEIVVLRENLTTDKLYHPGTIIHLHGSVQNPQSMVVTTRDYLDHYSDEKVTAFLNHLFVNFTVLFVGYSLAEEDILQYILRKQSPVSRVHYRLFPVFKYQRELLGDLTNYYRDNCNIQLIPFRRDEHDYMQLEEVIRKWSSELAACVRDPGFLEKSQLIQEARL